MVWRGRTIEKWRRSRVAISVTPRRSAMATTEASMARAGFASEQVADLGDDGRRHR